MFSSKSVTKLEDLTVRLKIVPTLAYNLLVYYMSLGHKHFVPAWA